MTEITMNGVSSSLMDSIGFALREGTQQGQLRIQFKNGAIWEYDDVPESVYTDMLTSESIGKYYHANIKKLYQGRRID